MTDPYGLALTNTFTLTVAASANRKPVIESIEGRPASGSMYLKSGVNQTFTVHATDPDGDNMTLRMYVNGKLRALASDVPSDAPALFYFSHELTGAIRRRAQSDNQNHRIRFDLAGEGQQLFPVTPVFF